MAKMVIFFKRSKSNGGYRIDGLNEELGYLGTSIAADYFEDAGVDMLSVGDTVLIGRKQVDLPLETAEVYAKYISDNRIRNTKLEKILPGFYAEYDLCRYLLTEERKNALFSDFEEWAEDQDKRTVNIMKELLQELKEMLSKVDFKTENVYFAIE